MKTQLFNRTMMLFASLVLMSCGGKSLNVTKISSTANPSEQISSLDTAVHQARTEKVNVLAPTSYTKAEASLAKAKQLQKKGSSLDDIFAEVSQGRAELKQANEMARVARTALPNVIAARDDAQAAGAPSLGKDYDAAEASFQKLTKEIEDNNLEWAKNNQPRVTQSFRNLELRAIKEKALGQARDLIGEAEKREAKKVVPETLALAKKKLAEADSFISQNRYNREEMLKKANEAIFHAERLKYMLDQSVALRKKSPEQSAIWMENMLTQIANTLFAPDMRNQTFKTQVENINGTIVGLQKDRMYLAEKTTSQEMTNADLHQKIASLEGTSKTEQEATARLEAEKRFNKLYGEVRSYFDPKDAEVYKQGDQLLIRLKAMRFPVGKSVIMPDNYTLLSKVQHAIRTFGQPQVTIEGHTDTTGSAAMNEHLSLSRADAVKEYFLANRTLTNAQIVSVGYGPAKPVAPNTTTEGRAMNRRIDVVISPEMGTRP